MGLLLQAEDWGTEEERKKKKKRVQPVSLWQVRNAGISLSLIQNLDYGNPEAAPWPWITATAATGKKQGEQWRFLFLETDSASANNGALSSNRVRPDLVRERLAFERPQSPPNPTASDRIGKITTSPTPISLLALLAC